MRLIDADALKYELFADNYSAKMTNQEVAECIDNSPTIDAVPVVRCKECGHYNTTGFPALNPGTGWCDKMGKGVHDDFYCSYGERKESEGGT